MPASLYGVSEESKAIWVYLEQEGGRFENVSLELLARGREMADQMNWRLVALILGHHVSHLGELAIAHGADEVQIADHPLLDLFTIEAYAHVVFQAGLDAKPSVFLLGATPNGRDLAGRLAVRFRTGLNADCTDLRLDPEGGLLVSEVSGFGGGVLALIEMREHRPQMATVRPGVFQPGEPEAGRKGEVLRTPVDLAPDMIQTCILERVIGGTVDLTRVPVLVIGGRGINGDFETLRELAGLLGGDVGATRPPVDEGHIERERQIGQTGVICRPKVALCCGLSGAFHLVVGIEKADLVIAINSDPEAPIFEFADYCILGDVNEHIPALIAALRSEREVAHA
jgi:electron transfer flavoprotein alpha subunit